MLTTLPVSWPKRALLQIRAINPRVRAFIVGIGFRVQQYTYFCINGKSSKAAADSARLLIRCRNLMQLRFSGLLYVKNPIRAKNRNRLLAKFNKNDILVHRHSPIQHISFRFTTMKSNASFIQIIVA